MMRLSAVRIGLVLCLMFGLMLGLMLGLMSGAAYAQDPQISVSTEQDEVVVGQPFILRVEVLVPTFMPRAPVFPTFEMPGLIVRLPERSTSPISRRIDGATWAGVQRTYRIYPMQAGQTDIPPQLLSIVYKDPESSKDVSLEIEVPPTRIVAAVPGSARTLDPLILARGLEIDQSWQLQQGELSGGDAVVRRLEVSVNGASALFVPPLLQAAAPQASTTDPAGEDAPAIAEFLTYPEDAQVTEHMELGVMSGTRIEQASYIAQSGGRADFPQIALRWYNLDTGEVEEITLEGRVVSVAMPPQLRTPVDRQAVLRVAVLLALAAGLLWLGKRWLWPVVHPRLRRMRLAYDASAHAAHRAAVKSAQARDLTGFINALAARNARGYPPSTELLQAVEALMRARYRDAKSRPQTPRQWQKICQRLSQDRPAVFYKRPSAQAAGLAPLNPFL
jgi:hypothetical protein